jgi:hypothetical protein
MIDAARAAAEPEAGTERYGVLVGWTHSPCGSGISVRVQSAASRADLAAGRIDSHHLLMTRNQALIFARYLLDATGQALPENDRRPGWRRAWLRMRRR